MTTNALSLADFTKQLEAKFQQQKMTLPPATGMKITMDARTKDFIFPDSRLMESFRGILVDYRFEKRIYKDKWKSGVVASPLCFAINSDYGAMAPDERVEKPFHTQCNGCPKNQWQGQGRGSTPPECADGVRLAVLTQDIAGRPKLYKLLLSRTAFAPFTRVLGALKAHCATQSWEFYTDPNMDFPSVRVRPVGDLDSTQQGHVMQFMAEAQQILDAGYDYD